MAAKTKIDAIGNDEPRYSSQEHNVRYSRL